MVIHAVYYQSGKCAIAFTPLKKTTTTKKFLSAAERLHVSVMEFVEF